MLFTIDIGNTNVTLGLYKGNVLGSHWRLATDHARMPDEYGLQFQGLLQNAGHTPQRLESHLSGFCRATTDHAGNSGPAGNASKKGFPLYCGRRDQDRDQGSGMRTRRRSAANGSRMLWL